MSSRAPAFARSRRRFSGGVAHNDHIGPEVRGLCGVNGQRFFTNHLVPCGDGGVSLGQAAYAGLGYRLTDISNIATRQDD